MEYLLLESENGFLGAFLRKSENHLRTPQKLSFLSFPPPPSNCESDNLKKNIYFTELI